MFLKARNIYVHIEKSDQARSQNIEQDFNVNIRSKEMTNLEVKILHGISTSI